MLLFDSGERVNWKYLPRKYSSSKMGGGFLIAHNTKK
jgi:hypothetical protein